MQCVRGTTVNPSQRITHMEVYVGAEAMLKALCVLKFLSFDTHFMHEFFFSEAWWFWQWALSFCSGDNTGMGKEILLRINTQRFEAK